MARQMWTGLALGVVAIAVIVLISWQVFDRPLGRVLVSAVGGLLFMAGWAYWYRRQNTL